MARLSYNPHVLRSFALFSALTDAQFGTLLAALQHRSFPARTRIIRAGEPADGLYVLMAGRVKVIFHDGNGRELIATCVGPNEFFGEVGLLDGRSRAASVDAQEPCETLFVPRRILLDCVEHNAAAAMSMLRTVTDRLDEAYCKMAGLALSDVYGRVARALLDTGHEVNGEWLVEIGSEQVAAMVGASREMVSRVVKDMIGKGLVRRFKRKLIVVDRLSLAHRTSHDRPIALPPHHERH
jgi:CRP/FNR family cyclic AMP-dependent transcriptional regulator